MAGRHAKIFSCQGTAEKSFSSNRNQLPENIPVSYLGVVEEWVCAFEVSSFTANQLEIVLDGKSWAGQAAIGVLTLLTQMFQLKPQSRGVNEYQDVWADM